jgi:carbon storage regulator
MLILSRKLNESIIVDGRIMIKIMRVDGDIVKLGIQAPPDVPVHRQEVYEEIQKNNQEARTHGRPGLPQWLRKQPVSNNAVTSPAPENRSSMDGSASAKPAAGLTWAGCVTDATDTPNPPAKDGSNQNLNPK